MVVTVDEKKRPQSRGGFEYLSSEYIYGYTAGILMCQHWFRRIMDLGVRMSNKKVLALLSCIIRDREILRENADACIVMDKNGNFYATTEREWRAKQTGDVD